MNKGDMNQQAVVMISPPTHDERTAPQPDFTIPKAKVPAVLLLIAGIVHGIAFFVFGGLDGFDDGVVEFGISAVLFTLIAILAIYGAFRTQRKQGCLISLLVLSSVTLAYTFIEVILRGLGVLYGGIISNLAADESVRNFAKLLFIVGCILLFVTLFVFALLVALIVIVSQKVCGCCGAPAANPGVVFQYQAAPSAPQLQYVPPQYALSPQYAA
ncbi:uncharacterized protein LOC135488435 [Lineus longissimus]|uniref:uncharacterized protein LOC135488435 n=1 Tax=Lineus longissimus TaxID=88925 RepID=UPI002B4D48F2